MPTVLIIGAGLAGLAAAIRFRQMGWSCTVCERTSSPRTIGGAINIAPNGGRLLARLGVLQQVKNTGCTVRQFDLKNSDGASLGSFPNYSSDGFVGIRIMRSELQRILLERAEEEGVTVEFGKPLASLKEKNGNGGKISATFNDAAEEHADLIIGADGIHSTVRDFVIEHDSSKAPTYTGTSLVYGLLDTNTALSSTETITLPATAGVFGPGAFFACAFCNEQRTQLYWISSRQKPAAEKLDDPDLIRLQELEKFGAFFAPIPAIIRNTATFFSWPVYELPVLEHWSRRNVVLVGDSAHALPPDKGQGFSQALEDIFVLARVVHRIAETGFSSADSFDGLSRYEQLRKPRVEKLREDMRRERGDRYAIMGPWQAWMRDWAFWLFLKGVNLFGSRWVTAQFGHDPDAVNL